MKHAKHKKIAVNPTIDTDAYTTGDVVGGLLTFDLSGITVNGGLINQAHFVDEDATGVTWTLYLSDELPTTIADDAAYAPTIADVNKYCAVVGFGSLSTVNSIEYQTVEDINNVFSTSTKELYGYLVCTGAPNPTNTDAITITLWILSE